jgi:hypothetical protein
MLISTLCRRNRKNNKPINSPLIQQTLRAWRPILTPIPVITLYFLLSLVFLAFGIGLFYSWDQTKESEEVRYDDKCGLEKTCTLNIEVKEKIEKPVYFYYIIGDFFANNRRFVRSRSDWQLRGETYSYDDLQEKCSPRTAKGDSHDEEDIFLPCGLMARYVFLDEFFSLERDGKVIPWTKKGTVWDVDLDHRYKNPPDDQEGIRGIADFKDENFITWMKAAPLPWFRKLYRKIDQDLEPGTYKLEYENNWRVSDFDGTKSVILSNTSWVGSKNLMLAVCYIVVAGISLLLAILFLLLSCLLKRRSLGNPGDLKFDDNISKDGGK